MATNLGCWFEIPSKDIAKSTTFYEKSFDVKMKPQEMGPMKMAMFPWQEKEEGASGALISGSSYTPSQQGSLVYLSVSDIDATLKKVTTNGGKILNPKSSIGEHGFIAHFEDIDGNRVGLWSMK